MLSLKVKLEVESETVVGFVTGHQLLLNRLLYKEILSFVAIKEIDISLFCLQTNVVKSRQNAFF